MQATFSSELDGNTANHLCERGCPAPARSTKAAMSRGAFRQADLERILQAAKKAGAVVQVHLRTLQVKILPASDGALSVNDGFAPDGKENWN